jgi:hypothetical protein
MAVFTRFALKSLRTPEVQTGSIISSALNHYFQLYPCAAPNHSTIIFFLIIALSLLIGMSYCYLALKPRQWLHNPTAAYNQRVCRHGQRSKYINSLYEYCTTHNIFSCIQALDHDPSITKAESIDKDMTKGMLAAEKKRRQRSQDPWSIAIQQAYLLVDIYKHALSMVWIGLESHHKLQRLLSQYSIPLDIPDSVSVVQKALRSAQKSLRTLCLQAAQKRRKMLQLKIVAAQASQESKQSRSVTEDIKALHAKLRFLSKDSNQQSGLKRLEVPVDPSQDPKQCTEWMTVDTPKDITKYLL